MGSTLYSEREVRRHNTVLGRNRKTRPKSFKSIESAKKWAEQNKISGYEIKTLPHSSKLIVAKKA